jgi:hypothetical protein
VSVIAVCGDPDRAAERCRQAGANAVIPKPVDPDALFARVAELLVVPPRKDVRVLLRATVDGREGTESFFGTTLNISLSGMLVEIDRILRPGDRMTCSFRISHQEIVSECKIVRTVRSPSGRQLYGVRFGNLDTKSLIVIEQFVKDRIAHI